MLAAVSKALLYVWKSERNQSGWFNLSTQGTRSEGRYQTQNCAWNAILFQNFRVRGHCLKPLTPVGKLGSLFSTDHLVLLTWHMKPHFLTALGPCWWQYFERGERVLFAPLGLWVPEHDPEFAPRDGNGQVPLRPRAPERSGLCPGPGLALCGPAASYSKFREPDGWRLFVWRERRGAGAAGHATPRHATPPGTSVSVREAAFPSRLMGPCSAWGPLPTKGGTGPVSG